MSRDPNHHHQDIDGRDDKHSAPFNPPQGASMLYNERNSVDDDLHKQLNFEHPTEQNEEQSRNPGCDRQSLLGLVFDDG